jgi:hypothetical protein
VEETERNGNHFGIFRCAAHKDEMKEVLCMPESVVINSDSESLECPLLTHDASHLWAVGRGLVRPQLGCLGIMKST